MKQMYVLPGNDVVFFGRDGIARRGVVVAAKRFDEIAVTADDGARHYVPWDHVVLA